MTAPVRPRSSLPATSAAPTLVPGGVLEGHVIGGPAFYFNGELGVLVAAATKGDAWFVPVVSGPPAPESAIYVPPDVNRAWQSLKWAIESGVPDGLATARDAARGIRAVR